MERRNPPARNRTLPVWLSVEGGFGWEEGVMCDQGGMGSEAGIRKLESCRDRSLPHLLNRRRRRRARRRNGLEVVGLVGEHSEQAW